MTQGFPQGTIENLSNKKEIHWFDNNGWLTYYKEEENEKVCSIQTVGYS
jgi:hypothetical protein